MQTPSECIPSQLSRASSELPLSGGDDTPSLSQSPHPALLSTIANDALAMPLSSSRPLLSLHTLTGAPAFPTPPPFSTASQASCFFEPQLWKIEGFPV